MITEDYREAIEGYAELEKEIEVLEHCIGLLSAREKTAFYLFHYDNLKQKEIAEIMGASLNEVKIWIHRARNQMKNKFSNYFQPVWHPW